MIYYFIGFILSLPLLLPIIGTIINTTGAGETKRGGTPEAREGDALSQDDIRVLLWAAHKDLDRQRARGFGPWISACMYKIETFEYCSPEMAAFAVATTAEELAPRGYDLTRLRYIYDELLGQTTESTTCQ